MFTPKKTKFRTSFLKFSGRKAYRGIDLEFGDVGIVSLQNIFVNPKQLEAARKMVSHATKRTGKLWIRVAPNKTKTAKGANVRMGSGKGELKEYVANVKRGQVLMEIGGIDKNLAKTALLKAAKKLPVTVKIVER